MEDDKASPAEISCQCVYCEKYRPLYDKIKSQGMKWLTISPPYNDIDPMKYYESWTYDFEDFRKLAKEVIIVAELTKELRMHFHIVYSVKDRIKEYKVINGFRKGNQLRLYKGEPMKGMHYLFKDLEDIVELLNITPILTMDDLNVLVEARKKLKKKEAREELEKDIPDWMKG